MANSAPRWQTRQGDMISIAFSSEVDAGSREGTSHQGEATKLSIPRHRPKNERSGAAA